MKVYFVVRAVVADQTLRQRFDQWYANDHLPLAVKEFPAEKGWRFWSETDPNVHYAVYRFADISALRRALDSPQFKMLVADFDRNWPSGITRSREILNLAGEFAE